MITAPRSLQFLGAQIADPRSSSSRRTTSARASAVYTPPSPSRAASLYDTLGVPLTATCQEIRAAYRRLARTCHPDAGAPAEEFVRLHAAYTTLSDPGKRADYDRVVIGSSSSSSGWQQRVQARPVSPFSGEVGRRRTWETDQCW